MNNNDNKNINITISSNTFKKSSRDELKEVMSNLVDDLCDEFIAGGNNANILIGDVSDREFFDSYSSGRIKLQPQQPGGGCADKCNCKEDAGCGKCYGDPFEEYGYNEKPYDDMESYMSSVNADFVDSVQYPLDGYIEPAVLSARQVEDDYSELVQFIGKAIRCCNESVVNKLATAHKMETATLLEYITQQNLITAQTIIDEYEANKKH